MLGYISSSYYSPNLERSIAYAIIKAGKQRHGDKLYVAYPETGRTVPVTVTAKEFM
jgi:sarcosine oxidase subunit alpha